MQSQIGYPQDENFKQIIRAGKKKGLKNCPVNVKDVSNSLAIYFPNRPILRGTKTRENPDRVTEGRIEIPRDFYRLHKFVTLSADLMFVGGLPFLITSSRHIKSANAEFVPTRTAQQLAKSLMKVVLMYGRGGFVVNLALIDTEFVKIKDLCGLVEVNTTAAQEHVPKVECMIRTVKQRLRSITSDFPFSPIPKMVLIHSVYHVIMMLNAFPQDQGVTGGFSPRELVTGRTINYLRDFRATVGAYAMVTNGQDNQTHPCITLGASGNRQG